MSVLSATLVHRVTSTETADKSSLLRGWESKTVEQERVYVFPVYMTGILDPCVFKFTSM
jgi:hypothetical protein